MESQVTLNATGIILDNLKQSVCFYEKVSNLVSSLKNDKENKISSKWFTLLGSSEKEPSDKDKIFLKDALLHCYQKLLPKKVGRILEGVELFEYCQICWTKKAVKIDCGCKMSCKSCLSSWVKSKVQSKDVYPWILCPSQKCVEPLKPSLLSSLMDSCLLANFVRDYLKISLIRSRSWGICSNSKCSFGIIKLQQVSKKNQI